MKFNQIKIEDAAGKTIERVAISSVDYELLIKYTDGSFSFLDYDYESIPDISIDYKYMLSDVWVNSSGSLIFSTRINFLTENGIIDKEKLSQDFIEKNKEKIESQKNQEYQTYLKLKEKFDGKSN